MRHGYRARPLHQPSARHTLAWHAHACFAWDCFCLPQRARRGPPHGRQGRAGVSSETTRTVRVACPRTRGPLDPGTPPGVHRRWRRWQGMGPWPRLGCPRRAAGPGHRAAVVRQQGPPRHDRRHGAWLGRLRHAGWPRPYGDRCPRRACGPPGRHDTAPRGCTPGLVRAPLGRLTSGHALTGGHHRSKACRMARADAPASVLLGGRRVVPCPSGLAWVVGVFPRLTWHLTPGLSRASSRSEGRAEAVGVGCRPLLGRV